MVDFTPAVSEQNPSDNANALGRTTVHRTPREITISIIAEAASQHGVSVAEVLSHDRQRHIVVARCSAMQAVKLARPHLSYPEMGRLFNRDHTSTMYHLKAWCRCRRGDVR